jgi:tRNA uridine 5-carbamoylmethylation protein Kti12
MIYWFTGQPGAGRTTLALALKKIWPRAVVSRCISSGSPDCRHDAATFPGRFGWRWS